VGNPVKRALVLALFLAVPALAGDGPNGRPHPQDPNGAPITSQTWRNATLDRTRRVVLEVIEKVRACHVDAEGLSPDRMREEAIEALRELVAARSFHMLEGEARDRFRAALQHVPDGDLDACLGVVDAHLSLKTAEDAWTISDVMARGAIASTGDPFTQLIDARTVERLAAAMSGSRLPGYGVKVGENEFGVLKVDHVSRGYDAFDKGIQDGDTIVEVDGRPTVLSSREEIKRRLQGDTRVVLRIWRDGFAHGHDVEVAAKVPRGPNADGEMLPSNIGYVRLDSFNEQTAGEAEALLRKLDRQGSRAIILDLRDNPGGSMAACAGVARLFLGSGKVVCKTMEREDGKLVAGACTTDGEAVIPSSTPVIALVNKGTASASEMLAGALHDHGRARLLGTKSYGKDVGQTPIPLSAALGERFLLVSTMKYRSPHDLTPRGGGFDVDKLVPRFAYSPAEQEELLRLNGEGAFQRYLADHERNDEAGLLALAREDGGRPEAYPGFEAWSKGLQTTLRPEILRRALRASIRAWAVSKHDRVFREDLEDDVPLQAAHALLVAELPPLPAPPQDTKRVAPKKFY